MKKILTAIFITLIAVTLTGCEGNKSARSIIGHTYGIVESSTSYLTIYFIRSGNASINYINGNDKLMTSHFTYDIKGDDVDIYYDYSNYWIDTAKGELFIHLTYDPIDDALYCMGDRLSRID